MKHEKSSKKRTRPFRQAAGTPLRGEKNGFWVLFRHEVSISNPLNTNWQRHVLISSGYIELGMLDEATLALNEIAPADQTRIEVLGARLALYMAARKWRLAAALARHLVKVMPENLSWWTQLAYAVRRSETIEKAEAILLEARLIHPRNVTIMLNLASYASVTGRTEEAKLRLRHAIDLDEGVRRLALDVKDLRPLRDWIAGLE